MAFNFNAVSDQLQDKANIFAAPGTDPNAPQAAVAPDAPSSGGNSAATSVNLSSGPGSSQTSSRPNPKGSGSGGAYNPSQAQAAYDGVGPSNYSGQTQAIGSKISSANDKLQAEANSYTQKANQTAEGYKIDDQTLGKAAEGDDASFQSVASRLSKTQPEQFEAFKGLGDDEIPASANALSKPSNFGDIYKPTAGASYSTGANRFNSMQLRRSGDFANIAMQLGQRNQDLLDSNAKQQSELTDSSRESLKTAYAGATNSARDRLKGMGDSVIEAAKAAEVQEEKRRAELSLTGISAREYAKLMPGQLEQLKAAGLQRANGLLGEDYDLSKFIKVNGDVNYTDFLDEQGAGKYNRVNSLLGNGAPILSKTKALADYDFDANGANQYLNTAIAGKQQAADMNSQSEIEKILATAGARATADQGDPLKNAQDYVTRQYLEQNEGQSEQERRAEQEAFRQLFNPETNWNPYYQSQGALQGARGESTAQDVITPAEAQRLNALAAQSGQDAKYAAGSQYNQTNFNGQYFDQRFKTTFDRILAELGGQSLNTGSGITRDKIVNPLLDRKPTSSGSGSGRRAAQK